LVSCLTRSLFAFSETILQDEGLVGAAKIAWNLLTNEDIRDRFFSTRGVLDKNENATGYIIVRAFKK
jgi:hypothetical protein